MEILCLVVTVTIKKKSDHVLPPDKYILKNMRTLHAVVKHKNKPYPELIKVDCQGAELDIIKGATEVLKHCKYLILELQEI